MRRRKPKSGEIKTLKRYALLPVVAENDKEEEFYIWLEWYAKTVRYSFVFNRWRIHRREIIEK